MVRPKKGTKAGDKATAKWHKTMEERLGSKEAVHQMMVEMGRKGGKISKAGGFASDKVGKDGLTGRERASIYGALGGRNGKRGPAKKKIEVQYEEKTEQVEVTQQ